MALFTNADPPDNQYERMFPQNILTITGQTFNGLDVHTLTLSLWWNKKIPFTKIYQAIHEEILL